VTLIQRTHESGLVVAEQAMDEARLQRDLKDFDRRLVLQWRPPYYVVVCVVSEHYAPVVATWMDIYGNPLPLSSGLLEKVKAWHVGARNQPETVDEFNERLRAEIERDRANEDEAIWADHAPYLRRGRVSVSLADTGKPRRLHRKWAPPQSGTGN
jgi:hypothetical protein